MKKIMSQIKARMQDLLASTDLDYTCEEIYWKGPYSVTVDCQRYGDYLDVEERAREIGRLDSELDEAEREIYSQVDSFTVTVLKYGDDLDSVTISCRMTDSEMKEVENLIYMYDWA